MDTTIVHICQSGNGPLHWAVPGKEWVVSNLFSERHEPECTCPAWKFSKADPKWCKHITLAEESICAWDPQVAHEPQVEDGVCPRCGGKTVPVKVAI